MNRKKHRGLCIVLLVAMLAAIIPGGETRADDDKSGLTRVGNSKVTVTFENDDGSVYHRERIDQNTLVNRPVDPVSKAGSIEAFTGWMKPDHTLFNPSEIITSDITLTAYFSADYTVTFYDSDPRIILDIVAVSPGAAVTATTKEVSLTIGQVLEGWKNKVTGAAYNFADPVVADLELCPQVKMQSQAIFVTKGSEIAPQTGLDGFLAIQPVNPTRPGYVFNGWYKDEACTTPFNFATDTIIGTVNIYAGWTPQNVGYHLNFHVEVVDFAGNPGTNPANYELLYTTYISAANTYHGTAGASKTISAAQAKAIYGLSASATAKEVLGLCTYVWSTTTTELAGDGSSIIDVYYKRNEYTFTFNLTSPSVYQLELKDGTVFDGAMIPSYSVTLKQGQNVENIWPVKVTSPSGNKFINWSGYYGNGQLIMSASHIKWALNKWPGQTQFTLTPSLTSSSVYTCIRLYCTEVLPGDPYDYTRIDPIDSVLRYYKVRETGPIEYQTSNPATSAKTWPGRAIEGFVQITTSLTSKYQEVQENNRLIMGETIQYDILYYMNRISYPLTFNTNGGSFVSTPTSYNWLYEAEIVLPTEQPAKPNADFVGWYIDENFIQPFVPGTKMPSKGYTLYAKYIDKDVEVNYYDESTLLGGPYYYKDNTALLIHGYNDPIYQEGMTSTKGIFVGWYYTPPGSTVLVKFSLGTVLTVPNDYDLYAQWEPVNYVVTYTDADGVTMIDQQTIKSTQNTVALNGFLTPKPTAPAGKYFIGWNTAADGTGTWFGGGTPVGTDIEVFAIYGNIYTLDISKQVVGKYGNLQRSFEFTVEFFYDDGTKMFDPVTYTIGSNPPVVVNSGSCTFHLKHGETIHFEDIKEDITYKITETAVVGYDVYITGTLSGENIIGSTKGNSYENVASGTNTAISIPVYNKRNTVIPSGISLENGYAIALTVIAAVGFAAIILRKRIKLK